MGGLGGRTEKGGRIAGTCPEDRRDGCRIAGDGESPGLRAPGRCGPRHRGGGVCDDPVCGERTGRRPACGEQADRTRRRWRRCWPSAPPTAEGWRDPCFVAGGVTARGPGLGAVRRRDGRTAQTVVEIRRICAGAGNGWLTAKTAPRIAVESSAAGGAGVGSDEHGGRSGGQIGAEKVVTNW